MTTEIRPHASAEQSSVPGILRLHPKPAESQRILLISDDKRLHKDLRTLANTAGQMVVRAAGTSGTVAIFQAAKPAAVVIDLDLPNEAAWRTAEELMREPSCPPVILLTGQTDWFEPGTEVRAGCLASKSDPITNLLEMVEQAVGLPEMNRAEWNAIQRVLLRWLKPSPWPKTPTSTYRFWGLNE